MIKQIGLSLRGRPILLITSMITDRIGLHLVLLPLLIIIIIIVIFIIISTVTGSIFSRHASKPQVQGTKTATAVKTSLVNKK